MPTSTRIAVNHRVSFGMNIWRQLVAACAALPHNRRWRARGGNSAGLAHLR